ncbi:hypothetical protein PF010_g11328 [Phytophthora fragariae]|uniref:Uncharacterized protein n=1 Tax=Phytophthora fragariae TaxID=53985 RepID=A0A6A3EDP4_9STRA|nr:hypothetical protein PF003_g19299 [Phytophthora fragariae]KAE8930356.1 hypothetical protein PF009_g19552 [Phytophthora fragariae]KAE8992975.1 hypothetical protein PF011_g17332 [Phytophthora fragariae]KAE9088028.1 hypothetical protein PF007_g20141 [Phytophthora fragariae]KAE9110002.1 hypothetical protein PF010_g11328 [Phytophthora fragariae]
MCNLYQAVFRQLFEDIPHGTPSRDLEARARRMLTRDSPEYIRFVTRVLSDAVHRALHRQPGQGTANPRAQRQAPPRGQPSTTRTPGIQRAQSSVIPGATRNQIPLENGTQVCMRFQVEKDLTFPRCPHVHQLWTLPPDVLQWVTTHHGGLKSGHPQHS